VAGGGVRFEIALAPKQAVLLYITVGCEREPVRPRLLVFERARAEARSQLDAQVAQFCVIETGNGQFDALVKRATSDLHMMTTVLPTRLYPMPECHVQHAIRSDGTSQRGVPLAEPESSPGSLKLPGIDSSH